MAALTTDKNVVSKAGSGSGSLKAYPVKANTTIFKGAIVAIDATGFLVPAADAAGLVVVGIADEKVVQGATPTLLCRVVADRFFRLAATGTINQASVGDIVMVADDQTVDDATTNSIPVGRVAEFISATELWVYIGTRGFA